MVANPVRPEHPAQVPRHIAVIMDGNGRWARRRALPRFAGHQAGIKPVRRAVEYCASRGVEFLTLFAFSSENWHRPAEEVGGLMALFFEALGRQVAELDGNGIRLRFIGDETRLGGRLLAATRAAERRTAHNRRMTLVVAVAYGGRWDLTRAARKLARDAAAGRVDPDAIGEADLAGAMQTGWLPSVDLLIRTGGERRLSNFLLWDLAYAELFFSDALWPDVDEAELGRAFEFYAKRQRRFGRTGDQVEKLNC
jgi:undecaprenyl diphosphate synthase